MIFLVYGLYCSYFCVDRSLHGGRILRRNILLVLCSFGFLGCDSKIAQVDLTKHAKDSVVRKDFTYRISEYKLQELKDPKLQYVKIDGRDANLMARQIFVELKSEKDLPGFLKKYGGRVVHQSGIAPLAKFVRYTDDSTRTEIEREEEPLPKYIIEMDDLSGVEVSDLGSVARGRGLYGEYTLGADLLGRRASVRPRIGVEPRFRGARAA
jgi:hypothetical protein